MIIYESEKELEIAATPVELKSIADQIEGLSAGESLSVDADLGANPYPYTRCLSALEIRVTDGPVRVTQSEDRVVVTASAPMMQVFASYFRFDTYAPRGMHNHHEWSEGDHYIAEDSRPVVVGVR